MLRTEWKTLFSRRKWTSKNLRSHYWCLFNFNKKHCATARAGNFYRFNCSKSLCRKQIPFI